MNDPMTDPQLTEQEAYVRERWERVHLWLPRHNDDGYLLQVSDMGMGGKTKDEAIAAAYAFTINREREIAEVEEEIRFIDSFAVTAFTPQNEAARKRILKSREAALAELKKGFRS